MDSHFPADAPHTLLLVFDARHATSLRRMLEGLPASRNCEVETAELPVLDAVRQARLNHGGKPLGVYSPDESGVLAAIEAGADDSLVLGGDLPTQQGALAFLDRVSLRARLRRHRERLQASAVQSEKLAALGTVVAGVAHEVNNPLAALMLTIEAIRVQLGPLFDARTRVRGLVERERGATLAELEELAQSMRSGVPSHEANELVDEVLSASETIASVVRDLKVFARPDDKEEPQVVHLPELMDQVIRIVGREITPFAALERDYAPDVPPVVASRTRLTQVFTNVLINAAHAVREVSRPVHRIRVSIRADEDAVAVSISDTGPGIPHETIEHIFDPFFTTKREDFGTGLGLSISRSIMRSLGGDLLVESVHGVGATFVALIQRPSRVDLLKAMQNAARFRQTPARRAQRIAVLAVDEDERMLKAYASSLREHCDVLLAADGQEAIELLMSGSTADVVVTDLAMASLDGRALLEWLEANRPELALRTIFVTTDPPPEYQSYLREVRVPVLQKPITRARLLSQIERAVGFIPNESG
ncbi:MAG: ATP-binding protein [Polyangiaceae bacterium]